MELESGAGLSGVLGVFAGRIRFRGEPVDCPGHAGKSDQGEGLGCAPSDTGHRGFEEHQVGVQLNGSRRGQVGAGRHRAGPLIGPRPAGAGDDGEVTLDGRVWILGVSAAKPAFCVGHQGQLAQCHAMGQGDGQEADEGSHGLRVQHRAVDEVPVGVGAVQDNQGQPLFGAGLHHQDQGGQVGVAADPHILNVEHHDLQSVELGGRRLLVGAVEAVDGDARPRVPSVLGFFSIGQISAESVLRAKGGDHIDARRDERVDEVGESGSAVRDGGRVVADDPDAPAFEEGQVGVHPGVRRLHLGGKDHTGRQHQGEENGREAHVGKVTARLPCGVCPRAPAKPFDFWRAG